MMVIQTITVLDEVLVKCCTVCWLRNESVASAAGSIKTGPLSEWVGRELIAYLSREGGSYGKAFRVASTSLDGGAKANTIDTIG